MNPKFDNESGVVVKQDLVEITLSKDKKVRDVIGNVCDLVNVKSDDFLTITHGLYEITIISEKKYEKKLLALFEKKRLIKRIDSLSSLSIFLPEQAYEVRGLFYVAMKAMHDAGINIVEIVSTLTELTFIVVREDTQKAKKVLEKLLEEYS